MARRQQLLPEKPPWGRLCTGADSLRLALRPDWAPPHHLPTHFVCIYAAGAPDGNAWALVAVNGHDARTDALAPLLREAGGPVILDTDAPQFAEATAHSNWQATLCAIIECLRLVLDDVFGQQPVLLRVEERWAAAVAGLTTGGDGGVDLASRAQTLLTQCRTTRDVWLTACRQGCGQWWTDRAVAIARQCTDAVWGQPANVAPQAPHPRW